MTLVDHVTGAPFAILGYTDDGGEIAALNDLLLRCDIRCRIITVDALHTARETARLITERCGADYVLNVKEMPRRPSRCSTASTGNVTATTRI